MNPTKNELHNKEADIYINGTKLDTAQAITLRVAVSSMLMQMLTPDALGLGYSSVGKEIAASYRERLVEIENIIFGISR